MRAAVGDMAVMPARTRYTAGWVTTPFKHQTNHVQPILYTHNTAGTRNRPHTTCARDDMGGVCDTYGDRT